MSYHRRINILIVDDEERQRETYRLLFRMYREEEPDAIEEPTFALSFEDAKNRLEGDEIFHMIIIDLGLPERNRQPALDGIEPGIQLIEIAARREDYPVPVVLVITGRLGGKTDVSQIRARLEKNFWYGQFFNKGVDNYKEISAGIKKSQHYCDVGVHLRDKRAGSYPPLTPREEDLLRRCVLKAGFLGVDLEWWSAEECGVDASERVWKKVLMGRFILSRGMGLSGLRFFKFEATDQSQNVHDAAAIAAHKLRHIKKIDSCQSLSRSLLVTESVCTSPPMSLDEFLSKDPSVVVPALRTIVKDIAEQLEQLGSANETTMQIKDILWPHFKLDNINAAVARWVTLTLQQEFPIDIVETFNALASNTKSVYVRVRNCSHGDLHAKNVAIEMNPAIKAFIFDTGAMSRTANVRDLALLEVTSLLFQRFPQDISLVKECAFLYSEGLLPPEKLDPAVIMPQVRNTVMFLAELHRRAAMLCEPEVYALLVFDCALMELSGLAIQSSRNKISEPLDAARLALVSAGWLRGLASDWFNR